MLNSKIFIIVFVFLFSCKKEKGSYINNFETETVQKTDLDKEGIKQKNNDFNLDYSFKLEKVHTLKDSAEYINHYYLQYDATRDSISERLFFRTFPNTFKNFKNLYGYDDNSGAKPLYFNGESQILKYYKERKYISDNEYFTKIFNVVLNGRWEADNISYLQEVLISSFKDSPDIFMKLLDNVNTSKAESFWIFFFDGPHPDNRQNLYKNILNIISSSKEKEKEISIIKNSYKKVKEYWIEE